MLNNVAIPLGRLEELLYKEAAYEMKKDKVNAELACGRYVAEDDIVLFATGGLSANVQKEEQ